MPRYIVNTWEHVDGIYEVEADSADEARAFFDSAPPINFDRVEQLDYQCFDVEVRSVKELF